jgi:AraC family transcriptional activator of pobA
LDYPAGAIKVPAVARHPAPTFYLYGEPHRTVGENFVHVEALDDRSRPSDWTIKPHAHAELCHIFLITAGGGRMRADGREMQFGSPCMLVIPATTVHGFAWTEETCGTVITMATRYVADLAHHETALIGVFDNARALTFGASDTAIIERLVDDLMRELGWSAPGHRAAVDATLLLLLVTALRNATIEAAPSATPGHHPAMVARLRQRIEQRFRLRESVADHAIALGVSETALRVACAKVASTSPAQILDQRALLEARRSLLYSDLSVAEIGYSLGFSDPAYFSRFFVKHTGTSPKRYRTAQGK